MSASGSLSLLPTGGPPRSSSFSSSFIPTPESYRSPPRGSISSSSGSSASDDDRSSWHDYHYPPTIQLERLTKIIDASLVLKGMASSDDDDEQKHDAPPRSHHHHYDDHDDQLYDQHEVQSQSQSRSCSPDRFALTLPPLKHAGSRNNSPSPGTATASGIAAMSLSFIINDDNTENVPANATRRLSVKENEYRLGSIEDSAAAYKPLGDHKPSVNVTNNVAASSAASAAPATVSAGFHVSTILNTVCAKPDCYRSIRGPPGSFCKYHKQSRFCRADGCNKSAKTGGYCISHGGGKRCSFENCSKSAKQGGLCISHGGGKRCSENGCTKSALVGGFCSAHGGGRKCRTDDCSKTALLGGYCIAHGGGKRCQVDGCAKSAVGGMLCVSHGGGKRCQADGCNKGAVRNGVCIRHGAKRDGASSSNEHSGSHSPSPVKSIKDENQYSP